jgi:predicted amidophosphoribosyltransferase
MSTSLATAGFPRCRDCRYLAPGPAAVCLACVRRSVASPDADACAVCAQLTGADRRCANELCRSPLRRIGRIQAIGYQAGPLRQAIREFKYEGAAARAAVFGRLLLAWLDDQPAGDRPDLIVANPGYPAGHAEAVLTAAAAAGSAGSDEPARASWPFDRQTPAAIVKTAPTLRSADAQAWAKKSVRHDLAAALAVPDPARTSGRFILVYDDVCTTGTQLDTVAACLLDQGGAARVEGVVLARAPWRGAVPRAS